MALIKCTECGKEISTTATSCPHCGYKTDHGKSITQNQYHLVLWIICVALMVVGVVILLNNLEQYLELTSEWNKIKHWYTDTWKGSNFITYLKDEGCQSVLWKVITAIAMIAGGFLGVLNLRKNMGLNQNSNRSSSQNIDSSNSAGSWTCACGRVNASYVTTCTCGKNKHDA